MDQQMIIVIVIACLFVVGYAVFLATIYFGPNMKDYFDQSRGERNRNRDDLSQLEK